MHTAASKIWILMRVLLIWISASGCFIPPGEQHFYNRPPVWVEASISPPSPLVSVTEIETACAPLSFSAAVTDEDVLDDLRFRWFVDQTQMVREGVLPHTDSSARPSVSWSVTPRSAQSPLAAPGLHTLELVIADGELLQRTPLPRSTGPNNPPEDSHVLTRSWVIQTEAVVCP